jgi:hypothetical protein
MADGKSVKANEDFFHEQAQICWRSFTSSVCGRARSFFRNPVLRENLADPAILEGLAF